MGDKVVRLADHNGFSSSRSVQEALENAIELSKGDDFNAVLVILLDARGDNYEIQEVSAGLDRQTDVIALLDITKTITKSRMDLF